MLHNNVNFVLDVEKLKAFSRKAGIQTIGELCEKANIHKNSITPYLKGERSPFTQVVLDIAAALRVSAQDLVGVGEDHIVTDLRSRLGTLMESGWSLFLFGSRARGSEKKFSDIDVGVTGGKVKLSFSDFSIFKSKAEDAYDNYPLSLNLVNLDMAPADFLLNIEPDLTFICGNEISSAFFLGYVYGRKEN
jgi:transcriptional regulator with XRE-family HTH domain